MKAIIIGFPKAGTSTLQRCFVESGLRSVHWQLPDGRFCGAEIYRGWHETGDPFARLPAIDCITQMDVCLPEQGVNYWPNLDFDLLAVIRARYPDCLFILNDREPAKIAASMMKWPGMVNRLVPSDVPGLPPGRGQNTDDLVAWIANHHRQCRQVFADDRGFIELNVESRAACQDLAKRLNHPLTWWGIENHSEPLHKTWRDWVWYPFRKKG